MYFNAFHARQAFLFLVLIVLLSSATLAENRTHLITKRAAGPAQVSGVDVRLEQISGTAVQTTKTDDKGTFTFNNVAPGSYRLRIGCEKTDAASPETAARTGQDSQKCNKEIRIVITEKSTGVISGTIRKES